MVGGKASRCVLISSFLSFFPWLLDRALSSCLHQHLYNPPSPFPQLKLQESSRSKHARGSGQECKDMANQPLSPDKCKRHDGNGESLPAQRKPIPCRNSRSKCGCRYSTAGRSARNVRVRRLQAGAGQNPEISDSRESRPFYCEYASRRG
jgi:hypothetical protein